MNAWFSLMQIGNSRRDNVYSRLDISTYLAASLMNHILSLPTAAQEKESV